MNKEATANKNAWEYRAYEYWHRQGTPKEKAAELKKAPLSRFYLHRSYFDNEQVSGKKIANPCGSNGKMAVALALLGADVTVFDISTENEKYALALAKEADVALQYVVGDFCEIDLGEHGNTFDIAYAEGGIIHYFPDIAAFMQMLFSIIKPGGQLVLSDFHPFRKINPAGSAMMSVKQTDGNYFDTRTHPVDIAYRPFFPQEEQAAFPKCRCRFYTISEIINGVIGAGFTLLEFLEHPNYENSKLPGLFTIVARKGTAGNSR